MLAFVGMETSGASRRALEARGWEVVSCDILESEDGAPNHIVGDVFEVLKSLRRKPDAGLFHPTCTVHTVSAAWAFPDPDFTRYPGVGYHQKVRPGTLTGKARRDARDVAEAEVERIKRLPFFKVIENPKGTLSLPEPASGAPLTSRSHTSTATTRARPPVSGRSTRTGTPCRSALPETPPSLSRLPCAVMERPIGPTRPTPARTGCPRATIAGRTEAEPIPEYPTVWPTPSRRGFA